MAGIFWTLAWVLVWVLAGLLATVLLVLATPLRLDLSASARPARMRLRTQLLGGLTPWITLVNTAADSASPERPAPRAKPGTKPENEPRKKAAGGKRASLTQAQRYLDAGRDLLAGLLRPLRIEQARVDGAFGLSDPASTGQLYGLLTPLLYAIAWPDPASVMLRPVFTGPHLEGEAEGRLRVIPLALAPPGLVFAWRIFGPGGERGVN